MAADKCDSDDWNERFQRIVAMPEINVTDKRRKYGMLNSLNKDFISIAKIYAKTIISEYFLPDAKKSIMVEDLGGVAGGKKFLWRGILFKLMDGKQGPYERDDEAAAKAMGHEMKSVNAYFKCDIADLHVALQALIDYKGFRMVAQAFLPIDDKKTLIIGSPDGVQSAVQQKQQQTDCETLAIIKSRSHRDVGKKLPSGKIDAPYCINALKFAANDLNISEHEVNGVTMYTACDVEGHIGKDGRFYILDLTRTFPPESDIKTPHLIQRSGFHVGQVVVVAVKRAKMRRKKRIAKACASNSEANGSENSEAVEYKNFRGFICAVLGNGEYDVFCPNTDIVQPNEEDNDEYLEMPPEKPEKQAEDARRGAIIAKLTCAAHGKGGLSGEDVKELLQMLGTSVSETDTKSAHVDNCDHVTNATAIRGSVDASILNTMTSTGNESAADEGKKGYVSGTILHRIPDANILPGGQTIFWRLLRPEFVKHRGVSMIGTYKKRKETRLRLQKEEKERMAKLLQEKEGESDSSAISEASGQAALESSSLDRWLYIREEVYDTYYNAIHMISDNSLDHVNPLLNGSGSPMEPDDENDFEFIDIQEDLDPANSQTDNYISSICHSGAVLDSYYMPKRLVAYISDDEVEEDVHSFTERDVPGSVSSKLSQMSDDEDSENEYFEIATLDEETLSEKGKVGLGDMATAQLVAEVKEEFKLKSHSPQGDQESPSADYSDDELEYFEVTEDVHVMKNNSDSMYDARVHYKDYSSKGMKTYRRGVEDYRLVEGVRSERKLLECEMMEKRKVEGLLNKRRLQRQRERMRQARMEFLSRQELYATHPHVALQNEIVNPETVSGVVELNNEPGAPVCVDHSVHTKVQLNPGGLPNSIGIAQAHGDALSLSTSGESSPVMLEDASRAHSSSATAALSPKLGGLNMLARSASNTNPKHTLSQLLSSVSNKQAPVAHEKESQMTRKTGKYNDSFVQRDCFGYEIVVEETPPVPLSSDALASFSRSGKDCAQRDADVEEATHTLIKELIPAVADDLMCNGDPLRREGLGLSLTEYIHHHGINMRHVGLLRSHIDPWSPIVTEKAETDLEARHRVAAQLDIRRDLLLQCVLRTLKHILHDMQRRCMRKDSSELMMQIVVIGFLNLVTGGHKYSGYFWRAVVTQGLYKRFGEVTLSSDERDEAQAPNLNALMKETTDKLGDPQYVGGCGFKDDVDILLDYIMSKQDDQESSREVNPSRDIHNSAYGVMTNTRSRLQEVCCVVYGDLDVLIDRLCECNGIVLSAHCKSNLKNADHMFGFAFAKSDVVDMEPVVKHMHQVDLSQGIELSLEAQELSYRVNKHRRPLAGSVSENGLGRSIRSVSYSSGQESWKEMYEDYIADQIRMSGKNGDNFGDRTAVVVRLAEGAEKILGSALKAIPDDHRTRNAMAENFLTLAKAYSNDENKRHRMQAYGYLFRGLCEHIRCPRIGISYKDDIFGIVISITHKPPPGSHLNNAKAGHASELKNGNHDSGVLPHVPINTVSVRAAGISLHSFLKYVDSRFTKKNLKCTLRFLPLIIDEAHADRSIRLIEAEMVRIDCLYEEIYETPLDLLNQRDVKRPADIVIRPYPAAALSSTPKATQCYPISGTAKNNPLGAPQNALLPPFTAEIGLRVISALMNAVVMNYCTKQKCIIDGTIGEKSDHNKKSANDHFTGYARLHHMLLYFAAQDPQWKIIANKTIEKFLNEPQSRVKDKTPDVGRLLIYLLLSDYEWSPEFAEAYIVESLSRQVFYTIHGNNPNRNKVVSAQKMAEQKAWQEKYGVPPADGEDVGLSDDEEEGCESPSPSKETSSNIAVRRAPSCGGVTANSTSFSDGSPSKLCLQRSTSNCSMQSALSTNASCNDLTGLGNASKRKIYMSSKGKKGRHEVFDMLEENYCYQDDCSGDAMEGDADGQHELGGSSMKSENCAGDDYVVPRSRSSGSNFASAAKSTPISSDRFCPELAILEDDSKVSPYRLMTTFEATKLISLRSLMFHVYCMHNIGRKGENAVEFNGAATASVAGCCSSPPSVIYSNSNNPNNVLRAHSSHSSLSGLTSASASTASALHRSNSISSMNPLMVKYETNNGNGAYLNTFNNGYRHGVLSGADRFGSSGLKSPSPALDHPLRSYASTVSLSLNVPGNLNYAVDDSLHSNGVASGDIRPLTTSNLAAFVNQQNTSNLQPAQESSLKIYNFSQGKPMAMMRENLKEELESILNVSNYEEFLEKIGLKKTPAEFSKMLTTAVKSAISKGYVTFLNVEDLLLSKYHFSCTKSKKRDSIQFSRLGSSSKSNQVVSNPSVNPTNSKSPESASASNFSYAAIAKSGMDIEEFDPVSEYFLPSDCTWEEVFKQYEKCKKSRIYSDEMVPDLKKFYDTAFRNNKNAQEKEKGSAEYVNTNQFGNTYNRSKGIRNQFKGGSKFPKASQQSRKHDARNNNPNNFRVDYRQWDRNYESPGIGRKGDKGAELKPVSRNVAASVKEIGKNTSTEPPWSEIGRKGDKGAELKPVSRNVAASVKEIGKNTSTEPPWSEIGRKGDKGAELKPVSRNVAASVKEIGKNTSTEPLVSADGSGLASQKGWENDKMDTKAQRGDSEKSRGSGSGLSAGAKPWQPAAGEISNRISTLKTQHKSDFDGQTTSNPHASSCSKTNPKAAVCKDYMSPVEWNTNKSSSRPSSARFKAGIPSPPMKSTPHVVVADNKWHSARKDRSGSFTGSNDGSISGRSDTSNSGQGLHRKYKEGTKFDKRKKPSGNKSTEVSPTYRGNLNEPKKGSQVPPTKNPGHIRNTSANAGSYARSRSGSLANNDAGMKSAPGSTDRTTSQGIANLTLSPIFSEENFPGLSQK